MVPVTNTLIPTLQLRKKILLADIHLDSRNDSCWSARDISDTRTDGLLHLALFRQHKLMRTTFLLATRDDSYGLLRRPIRYNTLLIPNTRMIRKCIYAILEGTLGLHQPPSNHHDLSPQPPEHYNVSW